LAGVGFGEGLGDAGRELVGGLVGSAGCFADGSPDLGAEGVAGCVVGVEGFTVEGAVDERVYASVRVTATTRCPGSRFITSTA
jgi:hypothetical protein